MCLCASSSMPGQAETLCNGPIFDSNLKYDKPINKRQNLIWITKLILSLSGTLITTSVDIPALLSL